MRIGVVSPEGTFLSWWTRLQDEGLDVLVYNADKATKHVGDGIVPKAESWLQFVAWCKQEPAVVLFDSSHEGKRADALRKMGLSVIGGGTFCDRLEEDRSFGEAIAEKIGCSTPTTREFSTLSQAIGFAKTVGSQPWYFKSNKYLKGDATYGAKDAQDLVRYLEHVRECYGDRVKNMLQQKIDGAAISTGAWWNGQSFVPPFEGTIEHKKFMDGELGPSTGCSFNAIWFYDDDLPAIARALEWEKLTEIFRQYDAPPCLYDINAVVNDGKAYFLEWTPRLGADSEATSHRLLIEGLGETLVALAQGRLETLPVEFDAIAVATRVSVPPYPVEGLDGDCEQSAIGTPVRGIDSLWEGDFCAYSLRQGQHDYEVAAPDGLVGIGISVGDSLWNGYDKVMKFLNDELQAPGKQFRTDAAKMVAADAAKVRRAGFAVPNALTR